MNNPYLLLWLEGPLQSWGHDSRFGCRDTLDFPTKSGVLGLLCCALGAGGEQRELLARLADLDMRVIAYVPASSRPEEDANTRPPLLRDFHMVGSGYKRGSLSSKDPNCDPWEALLIPLSADKRNKKVAITYRYYLQDAAFAVALQVPSGEAEVFAGALQNPVWDLFLGRKSCAPTEMIYQGVHPDATTALAAAANLATEKGREAGFSVAQGEYDGEVITLNDVPLQFGPQKRYRDRRVTIMAADNSKP